jgi:AraC-like DNA-binding protein
LAQIVSREPSSTAILKILDQFLDEEAKHTQLHGNEVHGFLHLSQLQTDVRDAATRLGRSARTLQRKVRTSTGLSPKQLLSVERFQRAVRIVSAPNAKLAHVAGDLKFADQAHLTREFRRHAGLTPGAFRKIWGDSPGLAVRFFQDGNSRSRLRLAAWATDDRH